ncbi:PLAT/LH2 domain-containing protein [Streptomyces sp. NPDC096339]|uniref:PLAT/LH2 domain-containing protein n=1 Tax=Streptomyces sp. NPDC096339 TaxID=3366086 RepID=UPI00382DEAF4
MRHPRRPARRVPKGVWAGAALVSCAAAGLAVGAMTAGPTGSAAAEAPSGPASSPSSASPSPSTAAPGPATPTTPTGPATYRVTVRTADVAQAGTDSDVQVRLTDETGRTSAWTVLDTRDHNDFEAGVSDTYEIRTPAGFGRPASLQLWKSGKDAWAVEAGTRVTGPGGYDALWRPANAPARLWITGGERAPSDGAPVFTAYSPNGTLSRSTP